MKIIVNKSEVKRIDALITKYTSIFNEKLGLKLTTIDISDEIESFPVGIIDDNAYAKIEVTETEFIFEFKDEFIDISELMIDTAIMTSMDYITKNKLSLLMMKPVKKYIFETVIPHISSMMDASLIENSKQFVKDIKDKFAVLRETASKRMIETSIIRNDDTEIIEKETAASLE